MCFVLGLCACSPYATRGRLKVAMLGGIDGHQKLSLLELEKFACSVKYLQILLRVPLVLDLLSNSS